MKFLAAVVVILSSLLAQPVLAQDRFRDASTGFAITVPAPFAVERTKRRQFDVGVGLRTTTGSPPLVGTGQFICEAGFKAASQNNDLTREEINDFIQQPEWRKLARATIGLVFNVTKERTFMLAGFRGVEYQARPKFGPGAEDVRTLISIIETPKGRTSIICLTNKKTFQSSLALFRSVRNGVTLPQ